jgi:hypothetical protein
MDEDVIDQNETVVVVTVPVVFRDKKDSKSNSSSFFKKIEQ